MCGKGRSDELDGEVRDPSPLSAPASLLCEGGAIEAERAWWLGSVARKVGANIGFFEGLWCALRFTRIDSGVWGLELSPFGSVL